jgi:hypothetical protein
VFSLGAVLFELLTGRRLREITDELAGWSQVASGVVPSVRTLRPDLPPAIGALLDRALAADPEARFPDAGVFGTAIREALAGLNIAVGASDLATLIQALDPPRRPRALMNERSKVIRLGPEARALREAIEAPQTPAPVPIPVRSRRTEPLPTLASAGLAPAVQAVATPHPSTPLPPPRPRGRTPQSPAQVDPNRRSSPGLNMQTPAQTDPNRRSSPGLDPRTANGAPSQVAPRMPTGPVGARAPGPRQTPIAPRAAVPGPRLSPARPFAAQSNPYPTFAPARQPRETARVQTLRTARRWPATLFVLLLLLGGAAFAVHRYLVPLDVLITWRSPARLAISTDPAGATLRLDGMPVAAPSPVVVEVHRDLVEHVLEASHPGFLPARTSLRYDKTVSLAARLVLDAAPPLPAPRRAAIAVPAPPPPPAAPARGRGKRR